MSERHFPITTKGDLVVGDANGLIARLGVGTDGHVLTLDSAQTLGVKWAAAAGGGGGDVTKVGTPVNDQIGVWTGDGTLEGTAGLKFNGNQVDINGTSNPGFRIYNTGGDGWYFYNGAASTPGNFAMFDIDAGVDRFIITTNGSVKLGSDANVSPYFSMDGANGNLTLSSGTLNVGAGFSMSQAASTTTVLTNGYSFTQNFGSNGELKYEFVNGSVTYENATSSESLSFAKFTNTTVGGGILLGYSNLNDGNSGVVGTTSGYYIGTAIYNTTGAITAVGGSPYGMILNFDTRAAVDNPNAAWFHGLDDKTPFIIQKDGGIQLRNIPSATTGNVLYYDTTTKVVSYGATPSGSGVALNDLLAADGIGDIDNLNNPIVWRWSTLTDQALNLISDSTTANSNSQTLVYAQLMGTNANSNQRSYAIYGINSHIGTGAVNIGVQGYASQGPGGNYGIWGESTTGVGVYGTTSDANGIGVQGVNALATAGTGYGVRGETTGAKTTGIAGYFTATGATNNYAIIVPSASGRVGFGTSSPTALLHLAAGNASLAPFKLTTGTALTAPEDGALEYHSSHLYFTIGSTRYQLDQQGGGSGITRTVTVTSGSATMGSAASTDYVYKVSANHTMTLPTAVGNTNLYVVKNAHSANITVNTTSSQTIDGTTTISVAPGESVSIISDNSNWFIV